MSGALKAGLVGVDINLPDDLWQSLDWGFPEDDFPAPGPGIELCDVGADTSQPYDWEKLLDEQEIGKIWPEDFSVDNIDPGVPVQGSAEKTLAFGSCDGSAIVSKEASIACEPVACSPEVSVGPEKLQRTSQASSSASQISIERQSFERNPSELRRVDEDARRAKRARSEDVEGSSEGDADSPEDSKKRARLVRNRESASQSRERKKQRMLDMEQRCASLEDQVKALSRAVTATALENAALREELARQQMYRYSSTVMTTPATGRSRARGAKKGTGTEPAVLSSDSLPWSSLFHRPTCPPWPLAPLESLRQLQPLASGPFLLFVLLLAWLAGPLGSVKGKSGSQMQVSSSRMCSLRVVSLIQCPLLRKQQRGRRKGRGNGARWMSVGWGNVFDRHVAASAA